MDVAGAGVHATGLASAGDCRLGTDPDDSVVNQWGQAWEVPNLYLMDGSVLPTGAAVNPSTTIAAMTLRNASHLRDRFAEARSERKTLGTPILRILKSRPTTVAARPIGWSQRSEQGMWA